MFAKLKTPKWASAIIDKDEAKLTELLAQRKVPFDATFDRVIPGGKMHHGGGTHKKVTYKENT